MLLNESNEIKTTLRKLAGPYDLGKPKKFQYMRYLVVKRNLFLGISAEYLLKAIFLKLGYSINKAKDNTALYRLDSATIQFDPCETVTFEHLKQHICELVDCSVFDSEVQKENEKRSKENQLEEEKYKQEGISDFCPLYFVKPDSTACLNYIQCIRNNYSHNAIIKTAANEFFDNPFSFLDFLAKNVFEKGILDLFNDFKPED